MKNREKRKFSLLQIFNWNHIYIQFNTERKLSSILRHMFIRLFKHYVKTKVLNFASFHYLNTTWYLYNSCLYRGYYHDKLTAQGTVILPETLIMPEPKARAISMLKAISVPRAVNLSWLFTLHKQLLCLFHWRMLVLTTVKVQIQTFHNKSTKGIYFLIYFDEMSKMNGHK